MAISADVVAKPGVVYPDSDGQPMADKTKQFRWIVTIEGGLDALFKDDPNVFVAGDLLWYPVEGEPGIRMAPDAMVVFGRPKGDRGSYQQWHEEGIPPQVVFEVLSPGNRAAEMIRKFRFYERYGVEEYYIYDPDHGELSGWFRADEELLEIPAMHGWSSPRLGVRFELAGEELRLYGPDGRRFVSYVELAAYAAEAEQRATEAEQRAAQAQQQADRERQERELAEARVARLAARLQALGIDPEDLET
jgi:Uma2 family endonuclease